MNFYKILFLEYLCFTKIYAIYYMGYLFTRSSPDIPLSLAELDANKTIIMYMHGYLGNGLSKFGLQMKDEFLSVEDVNFIIFDWSRNGGDYQNIVLFASIIGNTLGEEMCYVLKDAVTNVHMIGFGLGAHLAGYTAKQVKLIQNKSIKKISAIDPASPLINLTDPEKRLDKTDANQVIVYHCDGNYIGISEPLGTVDFYINGGIGNQPGCKDRKETQTFMNFIRNVSDLACSHDICNQYFIATVANNKTIATKCDSAENYNSGLCDNNEKVTFGNNVENNAEGKYYVNYTQQYDPEGQFKWPIPHFN